MDVDVAVFTNILKDKVDEFGGVDAYLKAQGCLFSKLQHARQRLVVNIDGTPRLAHPSTPIPVPVQPRLAMSRQCWSEIGAAFTAVQQQHGPSCI